MSEVFCERGEKVRCENSVVKIMTVVVVLKHRSCECEKTLKTASYSNGLRIEDCGIKSLILIIIYYINNIK